MVIFSDDFLHPVGATIKGRISDGGVKWKSHEELQGNPSPTTDFVIDPPGILRCATSSAPFRDRFYLTQDDPLQGYPMRRTLEAKIGWYGNPRVTTNNTIELVSYYRDEPTVTDETGISLGLYTQDNTIRLVKYLEGNFADTTYGVWPLTASYQNPKGLWFSLQIIHYSDTLSQLSGFVNAVQVFTGSLTLPSQTINRYGVNANIVGGAPAQGFTVRNFRVTDEGPSREMPSQSSRTNLRHACLQR